MSPALASDLPMPTPEGIAGGLSKGGLYYVVGVLCAVVAYLFWRLIADRDAAQAQMGALARETAAQIAENAKQTQTQNHMLTELRAEVVELRRLVVDRLPVPKKPPGAT